MRGYGSASRTKGKAMGSAGSGSALRGPTRPGTAARAALSERGRAGPGPVRKRARPAPFGRCSLVPSRAPRALPAGEEGAQRSPEPVPAVPGRAPPPGSGRAALTQADGSERRQRALTELRSRCLLHGGSLSPALQRGGNRGGSAPAEPLRRAAGVLGGAAGPRCPRPPGSREWSGRPARPHGRPALPLRGRWHRTDPTAAPPPLPHVTGPPASGCGGRARQRGERSAAPLRSLRAHLRGRRQRPGGAGGARPGAEGTARAEPARAAPAAALPVRLGSPGSRRAPAPAAMVPAARGPGPALRPAGPPLSRAGARGSGPRPGGRAQCRRRQPPAGSRLGPAVTRMPFPGRFLRSYTELAPLQLPRVKAVIGDGRTEKSSPGARLPLELSAPSAVPSAGTQARTSQALPSVKQLICHRTDAHTLPLRTSTSALGLFISAI